DRAMRQSMPHAWSSIVLFPSPGAASRRPGLPGRLALLVEQRALVRVGLVVQRLPQLLVGGRHAVRVKQPGAGRAHLIELAAAGGGRAGAAPRPVPLPLLPGIGGDVAGLPGLQALAAGHYSCRPIQAVKHGGIASATSSRRVAQWISIAALT